MPKEEMRASGVCHQDIICVLGMHRSGTSVLMRVLNLLGVELGANEFLTTEPVAFNPKGYWEHCDITAINDAILRRHGGSWDEPPLLPPDWETSPAIDDLRQRARQLIREHFTEVRRWGWKDPRSCLTLPFWQQLFPDMRYVICLRNPIEVAHSLEHRDGLSAKQSSDLWFTYVSSALNHSEGKQRLVIFYEDLMEDCLREMQRLADFLGEPGRARQVDVQGAVRQFVEKGLQHHHASVMQAAASPVIDPRARALYVAERISVTLGRKDIDEQVLARR